MHITDLRRNIYKKLKKNYQKWDINFDLFFFQKLLIQLFLISKYWRKKFHKFYISTYRYRLSVSADKWKMLSVFYRYRPIRKLNLSVLIGIGRYEKKLIDRTLSKIPHHEETWCLHINKNIHFTEVTLTILELPCLPYIIFIVYRYRYYRYRYRPIWKISYRHFISIGR